MWSRCAEGDTRSEQEDGNENRDGKFKCHLTFLLPEGWVEENKIVPAFVIRVCTIIPLKPQFFKREFVLVHYHITLSRRSFTK